MPGFLQQARYDQLIRRVGGIVGAGSMVTEALAELFPTIDVENVPGELLWLSGFRLASGGSSITAAGGQFAAVQLFNPVDSGMLCAVSTVLFSSGNTAAYNWNTSETPLANLITQANYRDTREGAIFDATTMAIRDESRATVTIRSGTTRALANTQTTLNDKNGVAVLFPGTGLEVGVTSTAITIDVSFFWRERVALQSERLFG